MTRPSPLSDLRGASRLAIDLTLLVTDVVETMHHNIARRPGVFGASTAAPTTGITGLVYRSIRGVTRAVGGAVDAALAPLVPVLAEVPPPRGRDAVICALNGVLGDHLAATGNSLAIEMQLFTGGDALAPTREDITARIPDARSRLVVLVHGLCMGEASWTREGHDHGRRLARELEADALYLRYNTGLHISTNGTQLSALLASLVEAWPVALREIVLVGHSMGGLVIRAACAAGEAQQRAWVRLLRGLAFLGTPHLGAPLERGGHGIDLLFAASPYTVAFGRLGRLRSAGITDLRHGAVREEDWQGRDRFARGGYLRHAQPLPANVPALCIAGSLSKAPAASGRSPRGDGLVPVSSALGMPGASGEQGDRGGDPESSRVIAYDTGHLELLASEFACERMLRRLRHT